MEYSPAAQGSGEDNKALDWQESFEWEEPPEWEQAADLGALSVLMLDDGRIEAALALLQNRDSAKRLYGWPEALHTPPAAEHYRHTYLWDSGFFMIIYSQAGLFAAKAADFLETRLETLESVEDRQKTITAIEKLQSLNQEFQRAGIEESFWLLEGQKDSGFIPNVQYADGTRWYEIEKLLSIDRVRKSSNYTQPPVLPLACMAQYKSMKQSGDPNAKLYLQEVYGKLSKFMDYFYRERSNSPNDRLIGVIDPHETGLDSLEQWDDIKPHRLPRNGPDTPLEIDERNRLADGAHFVIRLLERRVLARGNLQKERELFWANDVMMNCIYLHNLEIMAQLASELGDSVDEDKYKNRVSEVGVQIRNKMWQSDLTKVPKKGFYSLNEDGEPIPTITISNLFGLTLPNLEEEQLKAVLDMMDEDFDVPYPLPSTSINSPNYDPHNQERDRLWRGPTWINTNYYLVVFGLRMQAQRAKISPILKDRCTTWAERIAQKSNELIDMNKSEEPGLEGSGAREHYHPHTGLGQRLRVKNFGWTWLARFM